MEPGRTSARSCPPWAFKGVTDFLSQPAQREALLRWINSESAKASGSTKFAQMYERDAVRLATSEIESDAQRLAAYENASFRDLPQLLAERDARMERFLRYVHNQQLDLITALQRAGTFE